MKNLVYVHLEGGSGESGWGDTEREETGGRDRNREVGGRQSGKWQRQKERRK